MFEHSRSQGVKIPEGQLNDRSDKPELTVTGMGKLEFIALQFVQSGKLVDALVAKVGDNYYLAPNGQQWFAGMSPLSDKLKANVVRALGRASVADAEDIPVVDDVEVMATTETESVDDGVPQEEVAVL